MKKQCRKCKKVYTGSPCPKCGGVDYDDFKPTSGCAWLFLLTFILMLVLVGISNGVKYSGQSDPNSTATATKKESEKDNTLLVQELISASQKYVKQQLKAPSTAKFPGEVWQINEYKVYTMPDGIYGVTSWVDSQNGFGAMIRSQWLVRLKKNGDRWEPTKVIVE